MNQEINRLDKMLLKIYSNDRYVKQVSNTIAGACMRFGIDLKSFLDDIENLKCFDVKNFLDSGNGNLESFIIRKYKEILQSLIDITTGGNGGMASIGRGEFAISFLSNCSAKIIKTNGDLKYFDNDNLCEEVKYNGGKIAVSSKSGREVNNDFLKLVSENGLKLLRKDFNPFRKNDINGYSVEDKNKLNALYYQAITGNVSDPISDEEFVLKCLEEGFNELFETTDSLLIINENNKFIRFFSKEDCFSFYSKRINDMKKEFEIRNNQSNPISFYVGKNEII